METTLTVIYYICVVLVWLFVLFITSGILWFTVIGSWVEFYRAKRAIIPWVEGYKRRCTAQNRFVVTVETLQDSFREFDTDTIEKVWKMLVDKRVIQQDPMDNEWCIR